MCLKDFTGRAATRVGYEDAGTEAKINWLANEEGSDVFVPISVDRKAANTYRGGCTDLCYPRTMTLTIAYYQLDMDTKRIIDAKLKFDDFDKDPSEVGYTLNVEYYPLDYWDLIIKFAFENTVFIALFVVIGCTSVLVAALYWLNVRITTQVGNMNRQRFTMFSPVYVVGNTLSSPPQLFGTFVGVVLNACARRVNQYSCYLCCVRQTHPGQCLTLVACMVYGTNERTHRKMREEISTQRQCQR